MKRKIFSIMFALVLVLSFSLVTAVPVAAADPPSGEVVLVDFGPTPRTPSLEGTISQDGSNLNFSVTVLEQDAADDDYLAFWIDPDYLNKDLSGMESQFDSPWNEHSKLLILNFYSGIEPEWGDGTDGNCPWMQKSTTLPSGVSLTYSDTVDGMSWEGTIPFSVLGMSPGDTFGYMFSARIKTDAKYVDGYPEMVYGYTPGWDLRDYNTATTEIPVVNSNTSTGYWTIQSAIDSASPSDTILVAAGEYAEAVLILGKPLTLLGEPGAVIKPDENTPTYDPYAGAPFVDKRRAGIYIYQVNGVIIDGFEIDGTGTDVHYGIIGKYSDGSIVRNCVVHDIKNAIEAPASDIAGVGIMFWNQISEAWSGVHNVIIEHNVVYETGRMGIFLGGYEGGWLESSNNVIKDNEVYDTWQGPTSGAGGAVEVQGVSGSLIQLNEIYNNTGLDQSGISILGWDSDPNSIIENDIYNNYVGTEVSGGVVEVHYNNIMGNTYGVKNMGVDMVAATNNYWGSINGPTHAGNTFNVGEQGNAVSDLVDFVPWLDATYDIGDSFVPVTNIDSGEQFSSIQAAIDDPLTEDGGDTIIVKAGIYNESVTINENNLTIAGDPTTRPAITGGLKLDTGLTGLNLVNFYVTGTVTGENSVVRSASGAITDLTVHNCVFDGENVSGRCGFTGGQLEGDVSITGSEFKNILGWAVLDSRSGSGGDGSAMGVVTFTGNDIYDCNGSIVFRGLSTDRTDLVDIYGNTFNNIGGNEGQVGEQWAALEVNRAVAVNVYGNSVNGVAEGEWDEGQAFQFWDIDELYVCGNNITNNYQGIFIYGGEEGGIYGGPYAIPGGYICANNIVGNTEYGIKVDEAATGSPLDATYNWLGNPNGPGADGANGVLGAVDSSPWLPGEWDTFFDTEGSPIDTDEDGFSDLEELWLGTDPEVDTDFPGATIDPGQVDTAYVEGDDPGEVNLEDSEGGTIADVDISDGGDASGTITGARYTEDPSDAGLSVGTGTTGVVFLDVKVHGYTSGIATITVPYPDVLEPLGIVDETTIDETTLSLYYWDDADSMWRLAANNEVNVLDNEVSGDIPIDALTGTPVGMGGYLEDEALVTIESILNLNYSVEGAIGGTVNLTINTNTAFLGAATIDLTFDPRVVEVVAAENGAFDTLTVYTNYAHSGVETQTARFVVYQNQVPGEGVDGTGDVVVAEVKLNAVGSTMDESPLTLHVETLKDNKGDTIPFILGDPSIAIIGGIGDADRSGKVDAFDCVYIALAIAGFPGWSLDTPTMNVSGDDIVDAWDCTYLAYHLVKIAGYEELGG